MTPFRFKFLLGLLVCFLSQLVYANSGRLQWAKIISSSDYMSREMFETDIHGNIYIVGWFGDSIDIDADTGTMIMSSQSITHHNDYFVSKYDSAGNFLLAFRFDATSPGSWDNIHLIDVSLDSNIALSGKFDGSIDFDPGPSTQVLTSSTSPHSSFVMLLDSNLTPEFIKVFPENLRILQMKRSPQGNITFSGGVLGIGRF